MKAIQKFRFNFRTYFLLFYFTIVTDIRSSQVEFQPENELKRMGFETTQSGLENALNSPNMWAVICAIRCIAKEKALQTLLNSNIKGCLNSNQPLIRVEAAKLLASLGNEQALNKLLEIMNGNNGVLIKLQAADALIKLGDHSGLPLVEAAFLGDRTKGDRVTGARILSELITQGYESKVISLYPRGLDIVLDRLKTGEERQIGIVYPYFLWITIGLKRLPNKSIVTRDIIDKLKEIKEIDNDRFSLLAKRTLDKIVALRTTTEPTSKSPPKR